MATEAELRAIFDVVDDDKRHFALDTLEEYFFFKREYDRIHHLPLIRIDKNNPERQQITPAGKLIKDISNVLDAKRSTLLRILSKVESSAADELMKKLAEFE